MCISDARGNNLISRSCTSFLLVTANLNMLAVIESTLTFILDKKNILTNFKSNTGSYIAKEFCDSAIHKFLEVIETQFGW